MPTRLRKVEKLKRGFETQLYYRRARRPARFTSSPGDRLDDYGPSVLPPCRDVLRALRCCASSAGLVWGAPGLGHLHLRMAAPDTRPENEAVAEAEALSGGAVIAVPCDGV